jgi:hypothetical protein
MILVHGTGINQSDLLVLESHAVYSLSKEKTSARFYIMRCTQSVNEDVIQVPVKDVIERFGGRTFCVCIYISLLLIFFF